MTVRVPNPVSYIVQKLLVRKHRTDAKAGKDVLYLHDTLDLFGDAEELMAGAWTNLRPTVLSGWRKRCRDRAGRLASPTHPDVVEAARIAKSVGRTLDADQVAAVLRVGLSFLTDG